MTRLNVLPSKDSAPIVEWVPQTCRDIWWAHMVAAAKAGDLRLYVNANPTEGSWDVVVERASDGAIMASEPGFSEVEDAKAWAIWEPWKLGLVE